MATLTLAPATGPEFGPLSEDFRTELRRLGWIEGRNVILDARDAAGRQDRFAQVAVELVRDAPDVIVAWSPAAVAAAKSATARIPIVGASMGDPVRLRLVESLAKPGGNVTGLANLRTALTSKWVQLLKELLPQARHVALLANLSSIETDDHVRLAKAAAVQLQVEARVFDAGAPEALGPAFAEMRAWNAAGLVVLPDVMFWQRRTDIAELSARNRLPAVYWSSEYADAGGLLSYAPSLRDMAKRAAVFVDKILKGAKPADMPVEQPTQFELVLNLKTAKALDLSVPRSLLLQADRVIE